MFLDFFISLFFMQIHSSFLWQETKDQNAIQLFTEVIVSLLFAGEMHEFFSRAVNQSESPRKQKISKDYPSVRHPDSYFRDITKIRMFLDAIRISVKHELRLEQKYLYSTFFCIFHQIHCNIIMQQASPICSVHKNIKFSAIKRRKTLS